MPSCFSRHNYHLWNWNHYNVKGYSVYILFDIVSSLTTRWNIYPIFHVDVHLSNTVSHSALRPACRCCLSSRRSNNAAFNGAVSGVNWKRSSAAGLSRDCRWSNATRGDLYALTKLLARRDSVFRTSRTLLLGWVAPGASVGLAGQLRANAFCYYHWWLAG